MARVICVEIGQSLIKFCEMDYKVKMNPRVYRFAEAETPQGTIQDGFLVQANVEELQEVIKSTIAANDMRAKRVVFPIVSSKIISREITIPAVKDNMIDDLIRNNLTDYFPVDLSDYETMYSVLETYKEGPDAGKHRILVMAMDRDLVQQYKKLAAGCGLELENVFYGGDCVYQAFRDDKDEETHAIIKIEENYTSITIMKAGQFLLQRSIPYGIGDAIEVVLNQEDNRIKNYLDVWRLSVRDDLTKIPEVKECVEAIVNGATRIMDFYNSRSQGDNVDRISLVGMGAEVTGVREMIRSHLNIPCHILSRLNNVTAHTGSNERMLGTYLGCVGAGLSVHGFLHEQKKSKEKAKTNYVSLSILIAVFTVVLCAALVILSYLPYVEQLDEQDRLQRLKSTYEPGLEAYQKCQTISEIYQQVKYGENLTTHRNDSILLFLEELENKMPEEAKVTEFASNDTVAVMGFVVSDKEKAAKVIDTLRGFDSLMLVEVTDIQEEEVTEQTADMAGSSEEDEKEQIGNTEAVDTLIRFTVNCYYYPLEHEAPVSATGN